MTGEPMRIFVVHTEAGEIRSIVRVEEGPELPPGRSPVGLADDEAVTEIPAEGVAVELDSLELHENYRIDVARDALVRKA